MKKKLISKMVLLLILTAVVIVALQTYLNRESTIDYSLKKAFTIADIVRSGLTAHMVNDTMDKRESFLKSISNANSVDNIWVVRGEKVVNQYGKGTLSTDIAHDKLDISVLENGQMQYQVFEDISNAKLRVTIPYKADITNQINCLNCHSVQKGDTLGAVSIVLDISDFKNEAIIKLLIVIATFLVSIILLLILINKLVSPYLKTLDTLQNRIKSASKGEFILIEDKIDKDEKEMKELVTSYNTLVVSLMETFLEIEQKLKGFVGKTQTKSCSTNPLFEATDILSNLSLLYQFKKQIQFDKDKYEIYNRLGSVFQKHFNLADLNIFEFHDEKLEKVYQHGNHDHCSVNISVDCQSCRAYRNGSSITSIEHHNNCPSFENDEYHYFCIEKKIDKNHTVVFNFVFITQNDYDAFLEHRSIVENYIFEAKPEIEMRLLLQALEDASLKDGLTGLYNRRYFDTYVKNLVNLAKRQGTQLAMVMVDVDHFKAVNDEYGHDIGDKVLVETAKTLQQSLRETDIVVRFGGEEFVIILVDVDCEKSVFEICEKIRNKIADNEIEVYAGGTIKKTASFGFSMFPTDSSSLNTVMKNADLALYQAKDTGRNQVIRYKEGSEEEVVLF